jgi:hypothetical protein
VVNPTVKNWPQTTNCYVNATGQTSGAGCGGWSYDSTAYGAGLNAIGGGVYALDWRPEGIRTFWFPAGSIPADITAGNPTTANWGTVRSIGFKTNTSQWGIYLPLAATLLLTFSIIKLYLILRMCLLVSLTSFCGTEAAAAYTSWYCPGTCKNFVSTNATAYSQAYFGIQSLKVYQSNETGSCWTPASR